MKEVTVKIAVAVDSDGKWSASGWCDSEGIPAEGPAMDIAIEGVDEGEARYWLTATLKCPGVEVIEAEAEPATDTSDEK